MAVFLGWVLQLKPLMVVTEEAIPGPDTEKDESAETSDQSISCVGLNIQKTKIMAFGPITSWEIERETMETVTNYFLGLQDHCRC